MLCYIRNQLLEQDDVSRVVEETLIIVSRAMYYKPTNDTFISSINLELMELPTQMKKNADTMRIKSVSSIYHRWHVERSALARSAAVDVTYMVSI
jgi:hypothetical protein